jgi:hypothetical protein
MKTRTILQTLALLLFLVILPLGSWYYLKRGADYRIEMIQELGEYAQLSYPNLVEQLGDDWPPEDWQTQVGVWAFLPEDEKLQGQFGHYLAELTDQFEEKREQVRFFLIPASAGVNAEGFLNRSELSNLTHVPVVLPAKDAQRLAMEEFQLPLEDIGFERNPYIALTDSLTVKRYYDVREPQDMARLVEHIVFLVPAEKQITEIKREPEK